MSYEPRLFDCMFDEPDTRVLSEAYALACERLHANGAGEKKLALRVEIAAALVEAAEYGIGDKAAMAKAAIDRVYVDLIESEFV